MYRFLITISLIISFSYFSHSQQLEFSAENLFQHIKVLASDSLEGRATGTIGQKKSADYIRQQFVQNGLEPLPEGGYFHNYTLSRVHKNSIMVKSNGSLLFSPWHFYFVSGYNQNDTITTDLVFCGLGSVEEVNALNVNQKAIAFVASTPQQAYERIVELRSRFTNNTFFAILPDKNKDLEKAWETSYVTSEFTLEDDFEKKYDQRIKEGWALPRDSVNIFYCFPDVLKRIMNLEDEEILQMTNENNKQNIEWLKKLDHNSMQCFINYNDSIEHIQVENVGGVVYGKNPDQVIVVTAHYDHLGMEMGDIFYGADDNASGVSALIETGRLLAKDKLQGRQLERSVLFLAFSGEEIGLYGSKAYVNNPSFSLDSTVLNINMDMIGRWDKKHEQKRDFVYVLNGGKGNKKYFKLAQKKVVYPKYFEVSKKPGAYEKMVFRFGSDHYNFSQKNVPYSVLFTGLHDDYHTPNDTPDKINYKNLGNITHLLYQYIYNIADNPEEYPLRFKR